MAESNVPPTEPDPMSIFGDLKAMDTSDPYEGLRVDLDETGEEGSLMERFGRHGAERWLAERCPTRSYRIHTSRVGGLMIDSF